MLDGRVLQVNPRSEGIDVVVEDDESGGWLRKKKQISIFFPNIPPLRINDVKEVCDECFFSWFKEYPPGWVTVRGTGNNGKTYGALVHCEELFNTLKKTEEREREAEDRKRTFKAEVERQYRLIEKEVNLAIESQVGVTEKHFHRGGAIIPWIVVERLRSLHDMTGIQEEDLQKILEEHFFEEFAKNYLKKGKDPMGVLALRHKYAMASTWLDARKNRSTETALDSEYLSFFEFCIKYAKAHEPGDWSNAGKAAAEVRAVVREFSEEARKAEHEGYTESLESHLSIVRMREKIQEKFQKGEISNEMYDALNKALNEPVSLYIDDDDDDDEP